MNNETISTLLRRSSKLNLAKAGFTLVLAVFGIVCARGVEEGTFLDRVDLVAHEAGHLLFGYFGEFMLVIGGTLGQILVPAGFAAYFAARRELFSSSVAIYWIGQNLLNISVYVKDAATMELPLVNIGGGEGVHDWNWLLLKFNLLAFDQTIGNVVYGVGVLILAVSVVLGFFFSFEKENIR
jgi:hypothetical protein